MRIGRGDQKEEEEDQEVGFRMSGIMRRRIRGIGAQEGKDQKEGSGGGGESRAGHQNEW